MVRFRRGVLAHVAVVVGVGLAMAPRAAGAAQEYPQFSSHVVDEAGVVPDDVEQQVDAALRDYQARSGNQVAVAVVRTTGGRPIEDYALSLARTWGVGQQGRDNGVVVVIAYGDRRVRIEVGRGLESVLTNQRAAAIVDGGLVPRLRQGDVGAAVVFATEAVRQALGDEVAAGPGATPPATDAPLHQPVAPFAGGPAPSPAEPVFDPVDSGGGGGGLGGAGFIFVAFAAFAVIGTLLRLGGGGGGYGGGGSRFWGAGPGWGRGWDNGWGRGFDDRAPGGSFGPSHGSGGGLGGGGSFGGGGASGGGGSGGGLGGGGSFGGGGASGSW